MVDRILIISSIMYSTSKVSVNFGPPEKPSRHLGVQKWFDRMSNVNEVALKKYPSQQADYRLSERDLIRALIWRISYYSPQSTLSIQCD